MKVCIACGRGLHRECRRGCSRCHPDSTVPNSELVVSDNEKDVKVNVSDNTPRVPKKLRLKDPSSTGRKRAAKLYPLNVGAPCEWRGKKNCGGGLRPIIGCNEGNQEHRHHGPVKDTTRNEHGNVHRICNDCHVHWHELNDLIYDKSQYGLLPHLPEDATMEEVVNNYLDWKAGVMGQRYQLASSLNKSKKVQKDGNS